MICGQSTIVVDLGPKFSWNISMKMQLIKVQKQQRMMNFQIWSGDPIVFKLCFGALKVSCESFQNLHDNVKTSNRKIMHPQISTENAFMSIEVSVKKKIRWTCCMLLLKPLNLRLTVMEWKVQVREKGVRLFNAQPLLETKTVSNKWISKS